MKKADLVKILVEKYGYEESEVKNWTTAKLQKQITQEEKEAVELEKEKEQEKPREIKRDEKIMIMNGTSGGLSLYTKHGKYEFTEFGQTDHLEFGELEVLRNHNPKIFTDGVVVILDHDVVEKFRLGEIYKNILTPENVEEVFKKDVEEIKEFVKKLPAGMLQTFTGIAIRKYQEGSLNDLRLVKFIEEKFDIHFDDIV